MKGIFSLLFVIHVFIGFCFSQINTETRAQAITQWSKQRVPSISGITTYNNSLLFIPTSVVSSLAAGDTFVFLRNAVEKKIAASALGGWGLSGNSGTTAGTNFLGTTDNQDVVIKRNSVQSMIFNSSGTGIGPANPTRLFQVSSSSSHDSAFVVSMNGTIANVSVNRKTQFNRPALISAMGDGTNSNWLMKLSSGSGADTNAFCVTGQGLVGAGMHAESQFSVRGNAFNAFTIISPAGNNNCGQLIYNNNSTGNEIIYFSERNAVGSGTTDFRIQRFNSSHATSSLRNKTEIDNYFGNLALQTNSTDRLIIENSTGNISVGHTSVPSSVRFSVKGSGATSSTKSLSIETSAGVKALEVIDSRSVVIGSTALATNATDGFIYIPTCEGIPTGTPTAQSGTLPLVIDSTNNKLYIYSGGAWVALN